MCGKESGNALRIARWLVPVACGVWLVGCATSPEEDPVLQGKLGDLDSRTSKIERVVQNQSLVTLAQRADQLQNEISVLRGRIEVLENANETLRKQQRDLYADLEKRLASSQVAAPPAAGTPATSPAADADQSAYNQAFDLLKAGKYADAITAFSQFLKMWPQSSLADNGQYWLGESYYVTRDFQNAAAAFQAVLDRWPDSRKAPDALLKLGYTQAELKHIAQARATLASVSTRFPGSDAANLAAARLLQLPAQ
ncbi:MAG TPA: tol-pal system protein YbgF [Steroidobacteraceae bacterium]|jgi:tol-pal system protein YbgF|nr:tol-pal system protein YbgF [Steroidobacteraceae bacterium]